METCSEKVVEGVVGEQETVVDKKPQNMQSFLQMMMDYGLLLLWRTIDNTGKKKENKEKQNGDIEKKKEKH